MYTMRIGFRFCWGRSLLPPAAAMKSAPVIVKPAAFFYGLSAPAKTKQSQPQLWFPRRLLSRY